METITIEKKEYGNLKKVAGKEEYAEKKMQSWKSTLEILKDKELMGQIKESEKNRKKGILWRAKF